MSNRVDHTPVLHNDGFRISREAFDALYKSLTEEELPEGHLFEEEHKESEGYLYPDQPTWFGEFSAYTVDTLIEKVIPAFEGSLDFLLVYESGDIEGYRLKDGVVTLHKVIQTLGDPLE